MKDRIPTYPGRVELIDVETGAKRKYDLVMADEAVENGDAPVKKNLLQDSTAALYGMGVGAVPNDVFAQLALGTGNFGYAIKVVYKNGLPASGITLEGGVTISGEKPVTDENGNVVIVSKESSISVSSEKIPYIDIEEIQDVVVESTGIITDKTIILEEKETTFISFSGEYNLSPNVISYDLCAVGAGGGGTGSNSGKYGCGGGGGYAKNSLGVSASDHSHIKVAIGAGGSYAFDSSAGDGGTTTVSDFETEEVLVSANGGKGATVSGTQHLGGSGNGNGSSNPYDGNISGFVASSHYGGDSTVKLFEDPDGPLAGGGGGAPAIRIRDSISFDLARGGLPNGAAGSQDGTSGQQTYLKDAATPISPGGGGGGGTSNMSGRRPSSGASGGVYLRFHR